MDSIFINGQKCPVLKTEDDLPFVTHKSHHGAVAVWAKDLDKLMFDGLSFWCPVEFLRISVGDENIRKTPLTDDEIDRYASMVAELGDVGTLIVTEDTKGKSKLRILDGNNRFPIFVRECNPTHVFVKYVDTVSKLEEMKVQSIANTHTQTTHESEAFKALEAKTLTDALPKDEREAELSFFYAEIAKGTRGKTEFTKRWKRAKYAIPAVWQALSESKITVEVIDHLATLINPDTEQILADLQQEILDSAIAQNLKASQVQTKCAAAFANWEQSQQVVEEDEEEEFDLAPSSAPSRPTSAIAPKTVPQIPKPPAEEVTALDIELQRQATKATKGRGGKAKLGNSGGGGKGKAVKPSPKVTTNAPATIPDAITTDSNVHVVAITEPKPKIKDVDPYALLYAFERELVDEDILDSTGTKATPSLATKIKKADKQYLSDLLSQVTVMRGFLKTIADTAESAMVD